MVTFILTSTDPQPSFPGHRIFEVEYLKKASLTYVVTTAH